MFRLPVSGLDVEIRPPGGAEDLLLREAPRCDRALGVALLGRLASVSGVADLAIHDFETLLLRLRTLVFGDVVSADAACVCGNRVDVAFRVSEYLAHHAPRKPRGVSPGSAPGWFALEGGAVEFRLPTACDQIAVNADADSVQALAARCLRPPRPSGRAERAMEALSPLLSGPVEGVCPHCQATVELCFDVPVFVLSELKAQAAQIYDDVHLLASRYHWTEEHILALPRTRRQHYAERARAERE